MLIYTKKMNIKCFRYLEKYYLLLYSAMAAATDPLSMKVTFAVQIPSLLLGFLKISTPGF